MSRTLPGLGLTGFWPIGFNGWNADMDANLRVLSALLGQSALSVVDADPSAPVDGDIHLLSSAHPTHPGNVAVRDAGAWVYIPVPEGKVMYDVGGVIHRYRDSTNNWAELTVAGGGGGPTGPTALVSIDYKNGVYSIGGVSKTLAEVVEHTVSYGAFDPAAVIAGTGLRSTWAGSGASGNLSQCPTLTAAAFAAALPGGAAGGFTAVVTASVDQTGPAFCTMGVELVKDDFSTGWGVEVGYNSPTSETTNIYDYATLDKRWSFGAGRHIFSLTQATDRIAVSKDGGAPIVSNTAPMAQPAANQIGTWVRANQLSAGAGTATVIIEKIEFFATVADADLAALSAPPVVSSSIVGGVEFGGGAHLAIPSLTVTNSPYVAASFWIYYPVAKARGAAIFNSDPVAEYLTSAAVWAGGADDGKYVTTLGDSVAGTFEKLLGTDQVPTGQWLNYLVFFKGNAAGGPLLKVFQNRAAIGTITHHNAGAVTPNLNGKSFYVGSDNGSGEYTFYMADFWLNIGHDFFESDGSISSTTLDKFVTAALDPVDLGANGENPTGTAPAVFYHREPDAAPATFGTNLGTGGAATALDKPLAIAWSNPGD